MPSITTLLTINQVVLWSLFIFCYFSCTEALKTWNKPSYFGKIQTRSFNITGRLIETYIICKLRPYDSRWLMISSPKCMHFWFNAQWSNLPGFVWFFVYEIANGDHFFMWKHTPNVSTAPITSIGCWHCLSVVQPKGKHCHNGVVDTFGPWHGVSEQMSVFWDFCSCSCP